MTCGREHANANALALLGAGVQTHHERVRLHGALRLTEIAPMPTFHVSLNHVPHHSDHCYMQLIDELDNITQSITVQVSAFLCVCIEREGEFNQSPRLMSKPTVFFTGNSCLAKAESAQHHFFV